MLNCASTFGSLAHYTRNSGNAGILCGQVGLFYYRQAVSSQLPKQRIVRLTPRKG